VEKVDLHWTEVEAGVFGLKGILPYITEIGGIIFIMWQISP